MWPFDRYPLLRTVLVTTRTDKTFRGVLWQRRSDLLVLRNAELLKARDGAVPVDGELVILAGNVDFLQVVGGN